MKIKAIVMKLKVIILHFFLFSFLSIQCSGEFPDSVSMKVECTRNLSDLGLDERYNISKCLKDGIKMFSDGTTTMLAGCTKIGDSFVYEKSIEKDVSDRFLQKSQNPALWPYLILDFLFEPKLHGELNRLKKNYDVCDISFTFYEKFVIKQILDFRSQEGKKFSAKRLDSLGRKKIKSFKRKNFDNVYKKTKKKYRKRGGRHR